MLSGTGLVSIPVSIATVYGPTAPALKLLKIQAMEMSPPAYVGLDTILCSAYSLLGMTIQFSTCFVPTHLTCYHRAPVDIFVVDFLIFPSLGFW